MPESECIRLGSIHTNLERMSRADTPTVVDGEKNTEYVIDASFLTEASEYAHSARYA